MAAFDSVPLFMKSLPEDALDDHTVAALQSLAHDGTPDGMCMLSKLYYSLFIHMQRSRKTLRSKAILISRARDTATRLVSTYKGSMQNPQIPF